MGRLKLVGPTYYFQAYSSCRCRGITINIDKETEDKLLQMPEITLKELRSVGIEKSGHVKEETKFKVSNKEEHDKLVEEFVAANALKIKEEYARKTTYDPNIF